jgi:hypothetical protein
VVTRIDYYNDPDAPAANSIFIAVTAVVLDSAGRLRQEFSICFRGRPVSGEPTTSDESTEVRWVDRAEVDQLNIERHMRLRIEHGFADRPEPYFT